MKFSIEPKEDAILWAIILLPFLIFIVGLALWGMTR